MIETKVEKNLQRPEQSGQPGQPGATGPRGADPILSIRGLKTHFQLREGLLRAVDGIDLDVPRGKTLAVVGESGCGKSVTAFSILRLISSPGFIAGGSIVLRGEDGDIDLVALKENGKALRNIRGRSIGMIFQEPMTSFSPLHTIGNQLSESLLTHLNLSYSEARERTVELLRRVGVPDPGNRFDQFPHEMSGGLRQRAMIAMALACGPSLLIADEPTTALDVTVQAQILALLRDLQAEMKMSILLITHDLGVVAETADEVAVMYLGRIVERAPVERLFENPSHPYTQALLRALPGTAKPKAMLEVLTGSVPDPLIPISGCPFHPRCKEAVQGVCNKGTPPPLIPQSCAIEHQVACAIRTGGQGDG